MTDARYLVRERHLPLIPAGACCLGWRGDVRLDLSAPSTIDGIPTRLDPLPWALAVLAKRINAGLIDIDDIRPMDWTGNATTWEVRSRGGYVAILSVGDDGWEDYDHTDPNQPRRIVAAAIRNHVQKVSP